MVADQLAAARKEIACISMNYCIFQLNVDIIKVILEGLQATVGHKARNKRRRVYINLMLMRKPDT